MAKKLFLLCLSLFIITACNNNSPAAQEQIPVNEEATVIKENTNAPVKVNEQKAQEENDDEIWYYEGGEEPKISNTEIYSFYPREVDDRNITGFVPLTDMYRFPNESDSIIIDSLYLGDAEIYLDNYHILTSKYRKRFLNQLDIKEEDNIYVMNFHTETYLSYPVKDIPIMAILDPYGPNRPIDAYNYMVGFELPQKDVEPFGYSITYVAVAKDPVFKRDGLKWLEWNPMDSSLFPESILKHRDSVRTQNAKRGKCYQYFLDGRHYMIQNLMRNGGIGARHLVVKDSSNQKILFSKVYYESEGTYMDDLNKAERDYNQHFGQWTGNLFVGKPPVIFGFLSHSFGCELIDFISDTEPAIRVSCDNRH